MKIFEEKFVYRDSVTDIDLQYPFYHGDDRNEVITSSEMGEVEYWDGAPSIDTWELIDVLEHIKEQGAERVYIADHSEHRGYYFYGVKLKEVKQ